MPPGSSSWISRVSPFLTPWSRKHIWSLIGLGP
jgi:hypothetical protein